MLETFLGVFASFALWFGGQRLYRKRKEKEALRNMSDELKEEMMLNIAMLDNLIQSIPEQISSGTTPALIPYQMKLQVYNYIVKSGDIRLFKDFRKQRKIRYIAHLCEGFNHFVDNTENIVALLLLRENSLPIVNYRLSNLVDQAKSSRDAIYKLFSEIGLGTDWVEDNVQERNDGTVNSNSTNHTQREVNLTDINDKLETANRSSKFYFQFSLGFAALAIAISLALVPQSTLIANLSPRLISFLLLAFGLAILLLSSQEYKPKQFTKKTLIVGIVVMLSGVGVVLAASFLGTSALNYQSFVGLCIFLVGYLISTIIAHKRKQKSQ